jgi:hypothetical protein
MKAKEEHKMSEDQKPTECQQAETQLRNASKQIDTANHTLQQGIELIQETHHAAGLRKVSAILTKQEAKVTNIADVLHWEMTTSKEEIGVQAKTSTEKLPPWAIVGISCLCGLGAFSVGMTMIEKMSHVRNLLYPRSWEFLIGLFLMSGGYVLTGYVTAWLNRTRAEQLSVFTGAVFIVLNFVAGQIYGWGWLRVVLAIPLCLVGTFLVPKYLMVPAQMKTSQDQRKMSSTKK